MAAPEQPQEQIDWTKTNMKYNRLGNSGLKVSALSLGSVSVCGGPTENEVVYEIMTAALRKGVNFFDNAELYVAGKSELLFGYVFKKWFESGLCKRSDIVVSTKMFWGAPLSGIKGNPNAMGVSHKHLIEGVDGSLQRLGLAYVDLLFCHRPDPQTPIEETVRAMNILINQGKVFYWGTSEWSAQEITQAYAVAERLNLIPPLMEQPQYNLLHRTRFEVEYHPLFVKYGLGTTIWSPLASGLLTGKYASGVTPEGSRLSKDINQWLISHLKNQTDFLETKGLDNIFQKVDALKPIAAKVGCSLAVLSLAWCLKNKNVSTVITGASRLSQVEENLTALDVAEKLTPEILAEIEAAVGTKPTLPQDLGRGQLRVC